MKVLLLIFALAAPAGNLSGISQPAKKLAISLNATCDDPVGSVLIYKLREEIRKSSAYSLESNADITINAVCIDVSVGDQGLATAASFVVSRSFTVDKCTYTWNVLHKIIEAGRNQTGNVASELMASIDNGLHGG